MSLKRQFLWSAAPLIVVSFINILSVPLFIRYLGSEMYALWYYVISFTGLFGFTDLGLGVAVGRYIGIALGKGDKEAVRGYWATGNAIILPLLSGMAVVFILLGLSLGPKWFNVAPEHVGLLRACFLAGGVNLFLGFYNQFWNVLAQAHLDFRFISLLQIAASSQILTSLVLAWWTHNPLILLLWGNFINLIQLAIFFWHARVRYGLGISMREASLDRFREMRSYTGKTFATLVVNSFLGNADRLLLGKLAPAVAYARYTVAANAGGRVQSISVSLMGPVFHNTNRVIDEKQGSSPAAIYNETFGFTFGWYALLVIWIALWHPILLRLWFHADPAIGQAIEPLLPPLVLACCLSAIANISGAQLGSLNRVGIGLMFNILVGIATILGVLVGWYWGGITGAAYGFLFSRLGYLAQDVFTIRLIGARGWLQFSTWKNAALQGLVGSLFGLSYLWLSRYSLWLLVPAFLHGSLVSLWLLRFHLRSMQNRLCRPSSPRVAPSQESSNPSL
jgi:O-antigen/teichoic acid export membrane protein